MERLGSEVEHELGRFGPQGAIGSLTAAWPQAVGEAIARSAWPARVARDGTLHVHTLDAMWAFELTQHRDEIAARLGVPALRFAPGPLPGPLQEAPPAAGAEPVTPSREDAELAAELAAPIEDEELRSLVARAAAASLARAAADRDLW
jgi:Dna[CI] antecedent, DciA